MKTTIIINDHARAIQVLSEGGYSFSPDDSDTKNCGYLIRPQIFIGTGGDRYADIKWQEESLRKLVAFIGGSLIQFLNNKGFAYRSYRTHMTKLLRDAALIEE